MPYSPPAFDAVNFDSVSAAYSPPPFNEVNFPISEAESGAVINAAIEVDGVILAIQGMAARIVAAIPVDADIRALNHVFFGTINAAVPVEGQIMVLVGTSARINAAVPIEAIFMGPQPLRCSIDVAIRIEGAISG